MKSTKHIGFVIGTLSSGGAERVISTLSNELIERFEITIITFSKSTSFYKLDPRINISYCHEHIMQSHSIWNSIKLNYTLVKRIYQIIREEQIDLLIGFITSANILATIAAKIYGKPCIISERNNPLREKVPVFWRILRKLVYPMSDCLVLQTKGIQNIYSGQIDVNKITILPNPIATTLSNKRNSSIKREKIILTVGRLDKNKSHDKLITAFKVIKPEGWKVKIIGDGEKKQELMKLIEDYKLSDKIEVLSKVKDIDKFYNQASIFVFTSQSEGFPNALLEAMHFGLPAISTNCDFGPSDLINDGVNGFLIPINDQNVLNRKLSILINDKNLQTKFSEEAKKTTEKYTSSIVVAQWERLINSQLQ